MNDLIHKLSLLLKALMKMNEGLKISELAKAKLGTDFTNDKIVPDEVSCAYAVTTILRELDPSIPIIAGTWALWDYLRMSRKFERIYEPEPGTIVITPTNYGPGRKDVVYGHTGIYLDRTNIASNDSRTGLWESNFTRESWRQWFYYKGGHPIYLFRKIG